MVNVINSKHFKMLLTKISHFFSLSTLTIELNVGEEKNRVKILFGSMMAFTLSLVA